MNQKREFPIDFLNYTLTHVTVLAIRLSVSHTHTVSYFHPYNLINVII